MVEIKDTVHKLLEPLVTTRGAFPSRPFNRNLRVFIETKAFATVEENRKKGIKTIFWYASLQGGGKTRTREINEEATKKEFPDASAVTVTYTQDAQRLRDAGLITTGPTDERKESELNDMGLLARLRLVDALKREDVDIIHAELATINGLPLRRQARFIGPDIGGKALDFLLKDNPHLPPYTIEFIGLNVGPIQEATATRYRQRIKAAQTLEEIQEIREEFGESKPESMGEGIRLQMDGASSDTMMKLYGDLPNLSWALRREGIRILTPLWMKEDPEGSFQNMVRQNQIFEYLRHLSRSSIHMTIDDFFHGFSERRPRYLSSP